MRYLSFILFLLIGLVSCDTREDWFAKEGEEVMFVIRSSKNAWWSDEEKYDYRNDTVYSDNSTTVEFKLRVNDVRWIDSYYDPRVSYYSENLNLDIDGFLEKQTITTYSKLSITTDLGYPNFECRHRDEDQFDKNSDKWHYFRADGSAPMTKNDTVAPVLNTAHVLVEIEDAFRNKHYCHVKIICVGDIPPIPVMEIKDIDGYNMEKVLSLSKSYDKDGSISKYEYCIDGNIRSYNLPVYDCDPDGITASKGAYGGTYITSTEQSEVKHAFQTKGEHTVYYRCMDNLGLWSVWNSMTVTIK